MTSRNGLHTFAILGAALALACDSGARKTEPSSTKVLLVGIDGATWNVIDPLLKAGRLPTLRRLIDRGVRAPLESQEPMLSPSIWTTIATGRDRNEHGITGFLSKGSNPAAPRLVSSADRRVPALWNMLHSYGRSVGVIGWWASWPAEPVNGFIVSDRIAWSRWESWTDGRKREHLTSPEELFERVRGRVVDPVKAPPLAEMFALGDFTDEEKQQIRTSDHPLPFHGPSILKFGFSEQKTYENIALDLLPRSQPDLSMVFLVAVDPVSHNFWHFFHPEDFGGGVDSGDAARLGRIIPGIYEHDDAYLETLLSKIDPNTVVIAVSDHGFKASGKLRGATRTIDYRVIGIEKSETLEKPVNIDQSGVHDVEGILIASGGPFVPGARPTSQATVLDVAPTVLALLGLPVARNMPGRVLEELIDPEFLAAHPIQHIEAYEDRVERAPVEPSGELDAERIELLKALGYTDIESDDDADEREASPR